MLEVCGGGPNPTPAAAAFCKARRCTRSFLSSSPDFKADSWSQGSACTDDDMILNFVHCRFIGKVWLWISWVLSLDLVYTSWHDREMVQLMSARDTGCHGNSMCYKYERVRNVFKHFLLLFITVWKCDVIGQTLKYLCKIHMYVVKLSDSKCLGSISAVTVLHVNSESPLPSQQTKMSLSMCLQDT